MLIESLIRLGRPLSEGGLTSSEVLKMVSDVSSEKAKHFFEHVFFIEISGQGGYFKAKALPVMTWGEEVTEQQGKKTVAKFKPNVDRAVGIPFVLPVGGNPLVPQGRYGLPVYPAYDQQIQSFRAGNVEAANDFITGRVSRTLNFDLDTDQSRQVAEELVRSASSLNPDRKKFLGVVVIADTLGEVFFLEQDRYLTGKDFIEIGQSLLSPGRAVYSRLNIAKTLFLNAKIEEGAAMGYRKGPQAKCYFCDSTGWVVSPDCKALSWFATTWTGPLPASLKEEQLVESMALCPGCYSAMNFGANVFTGLTSLLNNSITKEIFSPAANAVGKEENRKSGAIKTIYGSMFALPVTDCYLDNEDAKEQFVDGIISLVEGKTPKYFELSSITGFESFLPREQESDDYRLTLFYFSGDPGRKDIHLHTTIEDVIPSTARKLKDLILNMRHPVDEIGNALFGSYYRPRSIYSSLPHMLAYAYGGPYLWQSLASCLHRQSLSYGRFIANCAHRLASLETKIPENHWQMRDEVFFFLAFNDFLKLYQKDLQNESGGDDYMRDWKEMLELLSSNKILDTPPEDVLELGFSAGYVTREFHNSYYNTKKKRERGLTNAAANTEASKDKIDFIKERIMTFGSKLGPDTIFRRGLDMMDEYARRLDMGILGNQPFWHRKSVVSETYNKIKTEIPKSKDDFMSSFWAGYHLMPLTREHEKGAAVKENKISQGG